MYWKIFWGDFCSPSFFRYFDFLSVLALAALYCWKFAQLILIFHWNLTACKYFKKKLFPGHCLLTDSFFSENSLSSRKFIYHIAIKTWITHYLGKLAKSLGMGLRFANAISDTIRAWSANIIWEKRSFLKSQHEVQIFNIDLFSRFGFVNFIRIIAILKKSLSICGTTNTSIDNVSTTFALSFYII